MRLGKSYIATFLSVIISSNFPTAVTFASCHCLINIYYVFSCHAHKEILPQMHFTVLTFRLDLILF